MVISKSPSVVRARTRLRVAAFSEGWVIDKSLLARSSEIRLELRQDAGVEMRPRIRSGNGVRLARIELQVVGKLCVDQLLDELDGVLQMHVVISGAMHQQQPS